MSALDLGGGGDSNGLTVPLERKSPTLETGTSHNQRAAPQDEGCKDGGGPVDTSGSGGRSTTPLKRKSPTPDTDMAHFQQATWQDEACKEGGEAAAASTFDDEETPVAKRPRLDTDTGTDASSAQRESSPEKQVEPSAGAQPDNHNGDDQERTAVESPRLDTDTDVSNTQREPSPEMQVETGASNQPDNDDERGDEESTAAGASNPPANHDVNDEEAPAAQPPKPEPKKCGICDKEPGKYKCPRCPLAYCSVACNKIHKENHPPPPPPEEQPTSTAQPTNTNSSGQSSQNNNDPYEVLLRHRVEFDRLMERYPGLERILSNIQKSTLPPPDDPSANGGVPSSILKQTGGVSGFVPPTYGANKPQQREIWSGEVGLRRGVAALKKARTNPGILGDGVREFCELVMYLLNNPSLRGGDDGPNATSLVRQEVVADQTKVIQTLLEVEKDGDDL